MSFLPTNQPPLLSMTRPGELGSSGLCSAPRHPLRWWVGGQSAKEIVLEEGHRSHGFVHRNIYLSWIMILYYTYIYTYYYLICLFLVNVPGNYDNLSNFVVYPESNYPNDSTWYSSIIYHIWMKKIMTSPRDVTGMMIRIQGIILTARFRLVNDYDWVRIFRHGCQLSSIKNLHGWSLSSGSCVEPPRFKNLHARFRSALRSAPRSSRESSGDFAGR